MKTILNSLAIQKHRGGSSLLTISYMIKKVLLENFLEWNQGSEVVQSSPKDWILFALESGLKSLLEPTCKLCSQSVEERAWRTKSQRPRSYHQEERRLKHMKMVHTQQALFIPGPKDHSSEASLTELSAILYNRSIAKILSGNWFFF